MEELLSLGLGGLLRLAPEVLDFFDRKARRAHEITLAEKNLAASAVEKEGDAMVEAIKAQAITTGIKWVDALNALVRPVLTYYWCIGLYTMAMIAAYWIARGNGLDVANSILAVFGPGEKAIVSSMITFWFVDRAIRYNRQK